MARIKLTDNARRYRRAMWLVTIAGLPALLLAIRGAQGRVPVFLGILGALLFLGAIGTAAMLGFKARRQTLADREMHSRRAMIVMARKQTSHWRRFAMVAGLPVRRRA